MRTGFALLIILGLTSCASARKLSQVGLREPASLRESTPITELRGKVMVLGALAPSCPKEVHNFAKLAAAKVDFPVCPAGFPELVQSALPYLKLEERSTMEEVANSQCRSLGLNEFGDNLEDMFANYDSTGPIGRRAKLEQTLQSMEGELKVLADLREDIREMVEYHVPLDRWVRRNGDYVLPEDDLVQLHRLIVEKKCRMTDQEVDQAYRTIRSLEELAKITRDGPQEAEIAVFLVGMHQVIEKKLKEFFYP